MERPPEQYGTGQCHFNYSMTLDGYSVNFQMVKAPLAQADREREKKVSPRRSENRAGVFQPYPSMEQIPGFTHVVALDFNKSGVVASHWDAQQENPAKTGGKYTRVTSANYQDLSQINKQRREEAFFRKRCPEYQKACSAVRKSDYFSLATMMAALAANEDPINKLLNIDSKDRHRRGWAYKLQVYKPRAIRKLVVEKLVGKHATREKTLVLQGNWNGVQTGLKGGMCFPVKQFNKELNRLAYVVPADEFRTSKMDSQSGNTPDTLYELKDMKHWVTRQRDSQRIKVVLWRVKRSPNVKNLKTWNRDKNAADNILQLYPGIRDAILAGETGKDNSCRPLHLQRQKKQTDGKTSTTQSSRQSQKPKQPKQPKQQVGRASQPPTSSSNHSKRHQVSVEEDDDDDFED